MQCQGDCICCSLCRTLVYLHKSLQNDISIWIKCRSRSCKAFLVWCREILVSVLSGWFVCMCLWVYVWEMVDSGGEEGASCSLQSRRKGRLLSRGSASWVCCWPDQLAVCLAGVWHITTKGFGQTSDCTALINPPIWVDLHSPSSLSLS